MMVKLTQDLARGFKPWKDMFHENEAALNALGGKLVFAGTEKDNDKTPLQLIYQPMTKARGPRRAVRYQGAPGARFFVAGI